MPMIPFGKWTPNLSDYELPGNVGDVDSMFPTARGYEPWWSYQTARPSLPVTANNARCIYGSASPQIAMVISGEEKFYSNVLTATSVWFSLNPAQLVPDVTFTTSSGSNVVRTSSNFNLINQAKADKIIVSSTGLNDGTLTVLHDNLAFSSYGALTTTANFLSRIHLSAAVTSEFNGSVGIGSIYQSDDKGWSLSQFRGYLLAANRNSFPCAASPLSLDSFYGTSINDLNAPFKAGAIGAIGEFVVCGDLSEGIDSPHTRNKIWWSAIGCPFDWIVDSATQCGNATLPGTSGEIRGIVSGEYGLILCANEIYRMLYVGLPSIFEITIAFQRIGVISKHSWATHRDMLFLAAETGFKMIIDGSVIHDIGKEDGIDDFFKQDQDCDYVDSVHCAVDGQSTRVFWSYRSKRAGVTDHDRTLCFDWRLQKWSKRTNSNLDFVSHVIYSDFQVSNDHRIGVIDNRNLVGWAQTATAVTSSEQYYIETAEYEHNPGGRSFIRGVRPVYDGVTATPSVAVYLREHQGRQASITAAGAVNVTGEFPVQASTRYAKYRINFGTKNFQHLLGFQEKVSKEGEL